MPKIKKAAKRKHIKVPVEFYDAPGVPPLFQHQGVTRDHLINVPCTYDASDPGTGKTRSQLEAWAARRRAGGGCLLILCPKSIMQVAWGDDLDKFFPLEFSYVVANAANRERAFADDVDVYITNLDAVKWIEKQPNKFFAKFDEIVIDEATAYKNPSSARSKSAARVKDHFYFRRLLCGTPMPKGVVDMWMQMYVLDDGARLGQSYYKFRAEMCDVVQVGPRPEHRQWRDKENASTIVAGLIADVTIRHKFEDCIDIPANVQRKIFYDLSPAHRKVYDEMKEHAIIEAKGELVQAANAAVLAGKLIQIASGSVYSSAGTKIALFPERVQLAIELVKEREHSIVFFTWGHQREALEKLANKKE